jgi:Bacterial PH domain
MGTYRSSRGPRVLVTFVGALMALIFASIAIQPNASHPGTAPGYIALGSLLAAIWIILLVRQLNARLVVTEDGLTWHSAIRTRRIAWDDIQDVRTVHVAGLTPWYSPLVTTGGRPIRIDTVIGPRSHADHVVIAIRNSRTSVSVGH